MGDELAAKAAFNGFVADMAQMLKPAGFRKRANTFHWEARDSWSVLNVQKSQWSPANEKTVTINLGVASKPLLRLDLFGVGSREPPPENHCHWRIRLGRLMDGLDVWWAICDEDSRRRTAGEISSAITSLACPLLTALSPRTELPRLCEVDGVFSPPDAIRKHRIAMLAEAGDWPEALKLLEAIEDDEPGRQFRTALRRRYEAGEF
ncbi:MAG TPA: DUF4304 domain-containing protein [Sphingomicrobium sp.]|nr:DUF4304 domain-containing protein [Sphingomicrobium sp.]